MDKYRRIIGIPLPKTCVEDKKVSDFEYRAFRAQITVNELERTPGEVAVSGIYGRELAEGNISASLP